MCTPHTLLHFILPNTLDNGPIILILLTRSQDWASLSSQIFSLYARHSVKYFLWIIFSNSHNYLSLAPWSPFYKKPLGRETKSPAWSYTSNQRGKWDLNSGRTFSPQFWTVHTKLLHKLKQEGSGSPWAQVPGFLSDPTLPRKKFMSAAQKKESQSRMDLGMGRWDTRRHWLRDFPGGPVVKTTHFHCRECRFSPLLGN